MTKILDATLDLVHTRGLSVGMGEIAAAADYTPGALYRYFPSKGSLVATLLARQIRSLIDSLSGPYDDADPLAPIRALTDALLRRAGAEPATLVLLSSALTDPVRHVPDEEAVHVPALLELLELVAARIATATAAGALRPGDPHARALRLLFGILGVLGLVKLAAFDPRLRPDELAAGLVDDLLTGWRSPTENT